MNTSSERIIFIVRHGEKPDPPPPQTVDLCGDQGSHGVDYCGNQDDKTDEHCLTPRGWSRAGALVSFFVPYDNPLRPGIATPQQLFCPGYPQSPAKPDLATTQERRTYQTIWQLSDKLKLDIDFQDYQEGNEEQLGRDLAKATSGITLVCWEHQRLPTIAHNITPNASIPTTWPDNRFDMVWSFAYNGSEYEFTQIAQMLLPGDIADEI